MSSPAASPRIVELPAVLRYPGRPDSPAVVTVRRRNRRERLVAVIRTWALSWLAAVAAVFLPVLHFILVPALLLGGPFYALSMRHENATLLRATGGCPGCGGAVSYSQKRRAVPEMALRCDACGRALRLAVDAALLADDGS